MIFKTHIIGKPLIDYVESIFYFKEFKPDHSIERVVPTGYLFIIFELDGFVRNTFDNESLEPNGNYNNVWVSGMHIPQKKVGRIGLLQLQRWISR